ncbi:hypothetical protein GWK47_037739 [Chionoecetes opilio]|uniref:Uncharacterized protein n=1 Tax=Chionoecetes opilio TaxID=41210 RepID=A0A8J4YP43_CHIOP|nr:hypothetical protein GWK47_037739 [Chionoecetes opilio]
MVELESSSSESSSPANAPKHIDFFFRRRVASPPKRLRTRGTKSVLSLISSEPLTELGSTLAKDIKETFSPLTPLTVHWDGKILPQDDGTRAERLAILVTGEGVEKLLGVPKLHSGTGDAAATAVFEALEDWGVQERVVAMCFDTTSANTGAINGACTILQQKIGRPLVSLACRHHVHELVLEKAFSTCLGSSSGPEITIFSHFKDSWSYINQSAINPPTNEDLPETLPSSGSPSFATEIYVLRWFESTVPSYAPANDLGFAKDILQYHDESIRKACFTTLSRHFWYLSEDLIGLSLFDSRLPVSDKQAIVHNVQAILYDEGAEEPAKRINLPSSQVPASTLPSFATKNSLRLFGALDIKTDFLSANPLKWQEEESYVEACRRIEGLRVVNDTAERGVALIQSFNLRLTKDEEQRQFLLQVVEAHRHQQPGTSKASLPRASRPQ